MSCCVTNMCYSGAQCCVCITPCPAAVLFCAVPCCCLRQRLPDQLLLLLQQAGVSRTAAAEALEQAAITIDVPNSGNSSADSHADETSATHSSDSSNSHGIGQARKLFGQSVVPAALSISHPALQRLPPQQQGPMAVLNRLQTRQLVQVLEDCQAPTFGDKQVLLQRLVLLLQEQRSLQGAHSHQQQQSQPQDDQQEQYGEHRVLQASDVSQQQQQQQRRHKIQQPASRQLPEIAAQQALLQSVLDVQQIGRWLLAARAQDVCIVDVRLGQNCTLVPSLGESTATSVHVAAEMHPPGCWKARFSYGNTVQFNSQLCL